MTAYQQIARAIKYQLGHRTEYDKLRQMIADEDYDGVIRRFRNKVKKEAMCQHRYWKCPFPEDDLVAVGYDGVYEACKSYDPKYRNNVTDWIVTKLEDKIKNYAKYHSKREQTWSLNVEISPDNPTTYQDLLVCDDPLPDENVMESEREDHARDIINDFAETLNHDQRTVLFNLMLTNKEVKEFQKGTKWAKKTDKAVYWMRERVMALLKEYVEANGIKETLIYG